MKNVGLRIETILSLILNVVLGALIFAWLSDNASTAIATTAGIAVIALGAVFAFTFPKLISRGE